MSHNSVLLKEWAENEIGFHGVGPVDWEGLCHGSLFKYWSHLISRVKSKKKTARLRTDFRHQIHQSGSLAELQTNIKMDEERKERLDRVRKRAALLEALQKKREGIRSLQESQAWQVRKNSRLIDVLRDYKQGFEDVQRTQSFVLQGFVKEIVAETQRIRGFRGRLTEIRGGILRWSSSEKQFARKDGSIESHCQRAINQGASSLKTRFQPSISAYPEEHHILESFSELGATQIRGEFAQAFLLGNKDLRSKVGRINLREDALRIQTELEKTQDLEQGGIQFLVQELTRLHAASGREAKRNLEAIADLESKNRTKLLELSHEAFANDSAFYSSQSKVILRNIELEMTYIKLNGILKKLNESISHNQSLAKEYSDGRFSKEKYIRIAKQADDIREAQADISNLISHNRTFASRLDGLISEINNYRSTELRERAKLELVKLLKLVENQFIERYEDFKILPIELFSCSEGSLRPSISNLQSSKASIHRLRNYRNGHPSASEVEDILKELNLSSTVAPGKTLLGHVMSLKRENDFFKYWLKGNNSNKFQSNFNAIENMSTELSQMNDKTEREDIPRAQENLAYLEELEESLKKVISEIEVWKTEPAQAAILEDPAFVYKEETLGKWQDKYRIAFLEWKKHQASKKEQQK